MFIIWYLRLDFVAADGYKDNNYNNKNNEDVKPRNNLDDDKALIVSVMVVVRIIKISLTMVNVSLSTLGNVLSNVRSW